MIKLANEPVIGWIKLLENAEEKIYELEAELFDEIRKFVAVEAIAIQHNARMIALIDCMISFAECAEAYKYVKPVVYDGDELEIIETIPAGKVPVKELTSTIKSLK